MPPTKSSQEPQPIALLPVKFFVRKKAVRPMLHALTGTQPNPYQPNGAPGLQDRTDISGKFARRLGGIRRALAAADTEIIEERKTLTMKHAEMFPDFLEDGVTPHPKAGQSTPVYATEADGRTPAYKKDAAGNDTEERLTLHDQYNLRDPHLFEREFKAMLEEFIVVECAGFTEDDWNQFSKAPQQNSPIGKIIDALIDVTRDSGTDATPEEQAAALDAKAKALTAEAEKIRKTDATPGLALVAETADEADEAEGATAP